MSPHSTFDIWKSVSSIMVWAQFKSLHVKNMSVSGWVCANAFACDSKQFQLSSAFDYKDCILYRRTFQLPLQRVHMAQWLLSSPFSPGGLQSVWYCSRWLATMPYMTITSSNATRKLECIYTVLCMLHAVCRMLQCYDTIVMTLTLCHESCTFSLVLRLKWSCQQHQKVVQCDTTSITEAIRDLWHCTWIFAVWVVQPANMTVQKTLLYEHIFQTQSSCVTNATQCVFICLLVYSDSREIRATGGHSFNTHTNTMAVEEHLQHPQLTTSPVNKSILDPENSTKKGASRWRRAASDVMKLHVQCDGQTPVHDWLMYDTAYASRHADLALLPIAPVLCFHDNEVQQVPGVFSSPDAVGAEKLESSPPQNASCSSLTLSDISDDGMYDTFIRGPTSTTYSHIRRAQPDGESQTDYMYITERARANDTTTLGAYVNNPPPTAPEGPSTASNLGYLRPLSIQGNVWQAHRADLVDYDTYRNGYDIKLGVPDEAAQDTAADRPPMNTPVDDASISL